MHTSRLVQTQLWAVRYQCHPDHLCFCSIVFLPALIGAIASFCHCHSSPISESVVCIKIGVAHEMRNCRSKSWSTCQWEGFGTHKTPWTGCREVVHIHSVVVKIKRCINGCLSLKSSFPEIRLTKPPFMYGSTTAHTHSAHGNLSLRLILSESHVDRLGFVAASLGRFLLDHNSYRVVKNMAWRAYFSTYT